MDTYCLDANFFIQAWNKYYSPDFCPTYWHHIDKLGQEGRLFVSSAVRDEIAKKDDNLKDWLLNRPYLVKERGTKVGQCLTKVYGTNPKHFQLVGPKGQSAADPWVIAHAMAEGAVVVTKEEKITDPNSRHIKIPNVCENMGIRYIDDFGFIRELNIKFDCFI